MSTKHFKITADASATITAAKQVSRAFLQIARAAVAVNKAADGFKVIPARLAAIAHQANITKNALNRLAWYSETTSRRIHAAYNGIQDVIPNMSPGNIPAPGRFGGGSGANDPRNRPLFGRLGSHLEQGQAVQNAIMAMLPALVPVLLVALGKYFNVQDNVNDVKFRNALSRSDVADYGGFKRESSSLADYAGRNRHEVENLFGELANAGISDARRASSFANLALGIEDAGGSAENFVKALKGSGPEVAEKLSAIAEELGINVSETMSVNQVLAVLNERLGGLAHEVSNAKEGWPQLWQTIKDNLAMLGEIIGGSNLMGAANSFLKGETYTPHLGNRNINDTQQSRAGFLWDMANMSGTDMNNLNTMERLKGTTKSLPGQGEFAQVKHDIVRQISENMRTGRITQAQAKAQLNQMYQNIDTNNAGALWDQAYTPAPTPTVVPTQLDGEKGRAVANSKNKISRPDDLPPTARMHITVGANPFQPAQFNGHGAMRIK